MDDDSGESMEVVEPMDEYHLRDGVHSLTFYFYSFNS